MIRTLLFVCVLLACVCARADEHLFKNTDVFELEAAADVQIAPDGSRIAYVRRSMDIMTDRVRSAIWIVDAGGDDHRPLLAGSENYSSPRWSPGGDRVAFISSVAERGAQVHVRYMDTGQIATLSNVREAPESIAWSPDGRQIAFEMFVARENGPLAKPPPKPEGAQWAPAVSVIETMPYRGDGDGYLDPGYTQIFVLSAEGGTPRQLTSGPYDHGGPLDWSADAERLYFVANRQEDPEYDPIESELWSVNVASGELLRLTDRDGPDRVPRLSADGAQLAYLGFDDRLMGYSNQDVYLMDLDDGSVANLTAGFDRSIDDVQWAGNALLVAYDDRGKTHIGRLSRGGKVTALTDDVGGVSLGRPYTSGGFSAARNGAYAYTAGRPNRPADIAAGSGRRRPVRLTDLNADLLDHKTLGAVEELLWRSGKYEIQGWVVKPPGFDPHKQYPLILEIHGGPFAAYGPQFSAEAQLYAAAGYVVLYANPRGSTSYGYDFANEIHHRYPGQDYDDLMAGVDAMLETGFIDREQLFVTGGSGGGVLSAWIVGNTDRFRAAVVAKPVINWTSFTLTADGTHFFARYWFKSMPWEDPDEYWARSPLSLVGNVKTPTALLTGEADYRTPISESEQYFQALKLRKIDTALIRVPEASHGIAARPSHLVAKVDNILAWFARYRKPAQ